MVCFMCLQPPYQSYLFLNSQCLEWCQHIVGAEHMLIEWVNKPGKDLWAVSCIWVKRVVTLSVVEKKDRGWESDGYNQCSEPCSFLASTRFPGRATFMALRARAAQWFFPLPQYMSSVQPGTPPCPKAPLTSRELWSTDQCWWGGSPNFLWGCKP